MTPVLEFRSRAAVCPCGEPMGASPSFDWCTEECFKAWSAANGGDPTVWALVLEKRSKARSAA